MSTSALLMETRVPISYLKLRKAVEELYLIALPITSLTFYYLLVYCNASLTQRSDSRIFNCAAMHTVFHVTLLCTEIRMRAALCAISVTWTPKYNSHPHFRSLTPYAFSASDQVSIALCNAFTHGNKEPKSCSVCVHFHTSHITWSKQVPTCQIISF